MNESDYEATPSTVLAKRQAGFAQAPVTIRGVLAVPPVGPAQALVTATLSFWQRTRSYFILLESDAQPLGLFGITATGSFGHLTHSHLVVLASDAQPLCRFGIRRPASSSTWHLTSSQLISRGCTAAKRDQSIGTLLFQARTDRSFDSVGLSSAESL
jgi:hypothetical protein